MPDSHDALAAVPSAGQPSKALVRPLLVARYPYVLTGDDDVTDLDAVNDGSTIQSLVFAGKLFTLDPDDTTTAHDGVSVLVSADGKRFKLDSVAVPAASVLDRDIDDPPADPALGDAYLTSAAPTGAWSANAEQVAIYTARGWEFIANRVGALVYVEDEDAFYRYTAAGAWAAGPGGLVVQADSVPLSALINVGRYFRVENQTTTAPLGTAAVGVAYIIGPSATGAWAVHDAKLAVCEVVDTFTIYTPLEGWEAYDKATNTRYVYNGSAWISSLGAVVDYDSVIDDGDSSTGSGNYSYSESTAPVITQQGNIDANGLEYTARAAGKWLAISFSCGSDRAYNALALFRDSETNAIEW